jgi:AraC-like DNA-binding protein
LNRLPKIYLYRRIVQAKLFIDGNYEKKLDLDALSQEACFSKFHFMREFKRIYAKTPHQYLISVRLQKAKELLSEQCSVADVSLAVGFESVTSFTALFSRVAGITPKKYNRLQLDRKRQIQSQPLSFIPACFAENKGWIKKSNFQ